MSRSDEEVREAKGVKGEPNTLALFQEHLLALIKEQNLQKTGFSFSSPRLLFPSWEVISCFLTRETFQVYSCRSPTLAIRPCFRNESSNTSLSLNCHTAPRRRCYVGVKKSFYRLRLSTDAACSSVAYQACL